MDWIRVSEHAAERWHERTDAPGVGPIVAWDEGLPIHSIPTIECDEARFHEPTQTLLLRRGESLVTVISLEGARKPVRKTIEMAV